MSNLNSSNSNVARSDTAESVPGALRLTIEKHFIGMVVPPRAKFEGDLHLECGVVIYGMFRGTINCTRGAAIIAPGGEFHGRLAADLIIIAGKVGDLQKAAKDSALLLATRELAIADSADVHGVLRAPTFNIPKGAKLNSSVIKSMIGSEG
ncbi:MAG: polymer-forming cytoskeletal protein [Burkholderiaceae bacterium]|nr:MAG: polymer-forming cytoskeletal protein [Burkholderiaceae bacterium]TBR76723.1 MAG: polymer-forming cytoskeletal protein [Burkholderiaceae bacterium]